MDSSILVHIAAAALNSIILAGLAVPVLWLLRKFSASLKHQILVGTFVGLLLLPVLAALLPTWNVPILSGLPFDDGVAGRSTETPVVVAAEPSPNLSPIVLDPTAVGTGTEEFSAVGAANTAATAQNSPEVQTAWSSAALTHMAGWITSGKATTILLIVWGIGLLAVFVLQLVRWAGAGFIAETAAAVDNAGHVRMANRLCREMGIEQPVILVQSGMSAVTMTWGIRKPYIVLPADSDKWSPDETEAILRHELAHIRRKDNLIQFVAVFACALYWFNPLAWKILRRLQMEREIACDDYVLNSGTTASTYARYLMDMSIKLKGPKSQKVIPAVMAHSSNIKKRLLNILDPEANRRPAAVLTSLLCVVLILSAAIPVAAFRLWGDGDKSSTSYRMRGSAYYEDEALRLEDLTLKGKAGDFEVKADNVLLEPDSRAGYEFADDDGFLIIKTEHQGEDWEYRVECDNSEITKSFFRGGDEHPFTDERDAEFGDLVDRLTDLLMPNGGFGARARTAERAYSSALSRAGTRAAVRARASYRDALELYDSRRVRDRLKNRVSGIANVPDYYADPTYQSNSYRMRGTSADHNEGVLLTDVSLESADGDLEAEIDNIILNPDDSLGFHYRYGKGYIYLLKEKDGKEYEYRMERRKTRDGWEETRSFWIDGKENDFNDERVEEFKELVEEIDDIFSPMHGHGSVPDTESLRKTFGTVRSGGTPPILLSDGDDQITIATPQTLPSLYRGGYLSSPAVVGWFDGRSADNDLLISLAEGGLMTSGASYDAPLLDFMEQIGEELEQIRDYHGTMLNDRAGRKAIEEAYRARHEEINRIIKRMMDELGDDDDLDAALRGVKDVFDQYFKVAMDAWNELGTQRMRNRLKDALIDLYEDFEAMAVSHLNDLERRRTRVTLRAEKEKIYEAVAEHAVKTIEELMKL